ncbi:uncharacterized protein TNCV_93811 [Trichonephila clavipes]|nr:uncharacterized protein TNCV_93811 [Trichonephila clavipes]
MSACEPNCRHLREVLIFCFNMKKSAAEAHRMLSNTYATRGLLATDHVILNNGQVTWTPPDLAPPLLTTTPLQWEDVSALDRFNVHRCPTRWVYSGTGHELVIRQATVRYLYHSATTANRNVGKINWNCV